MIKIDNDQLYTLIAAIFIGLSLATDRVFGGCLLGTSGLLIMLLK